MPTTLQGRTLLAVRFVFGGASWLVPALTMRLLGLDPGSNPQAAYASRLFGARDAALGVGLVATRGDARRLWWKIGIACDLLDAAAGVVASWNNQLPPKTKTRAMLTLAGLLGAALGASALAADDV